MSERVGAMREAFPLRHSVLDTESPAPLHLYYQEMAGQARHDVVFFAWSPPQITWSPPQTSWSPPQIAWSPPQTAWSPPQTAWSPPQTAWTILKI
ncbi:MAG: hypothetical protein LBT48_03275 [Prevotellaceae bacterium]|nr:hypothetical protein [Prevotellaceae bacterium]